MFSFLFFSAKKQVRKRSILFLLFFVFFCTQGCDEGKVAGTSQTGTVLFPDQGKEQEKQLPLIRVFRLVKGGVLPKITGMGTVLRFLEGDIITPCAGTVGRVAVDEGGEVRVGQVLLELDHALLWKQLGVAEQHKETLLAQQKTIHLPLKLHLEHEQLLLDQQQGSVLETGQVLENTRKPADFSEQAIRERLRRKQISLQKELDETELLIKQLQQRNAFTYVRSPITGILRSLVVAVGEKVDIGDLLGQVVSQSDYLMEVKIPSADSLIQSRKSLLKNEVEVVFQRFPGEVFWGTLFPAVSRLDKDHTAKNGLIIRLAHYAGRLAKGMQGRVVFSSKELSDIFLLPATALGKVDQEQFLYLLQGDKLVKKKVSVFYQSQATVVVKGQLLEGSLVVQEYVPSFIDGMRVKTEQ